MFENISKLLVSGALVVFASGCSSTRFVDGETRDLSIRYERPAAVGEDGSLFKVGSNYRASYAQTLRRLRQSGFEITSSEVALGEIRAESNEVNLVDCGNIGVGNKGSSTIFPANAAVSLLEVPAGAQASTFLKRQFKSHTTVIVRLGVSSQENGAIFAAVRESHTASLVLTQAGNDSVVYEQSLQFAGNETGVFRRGIVCESSGEVREIILGN